LLALTSSARVEMLMSLCAVPSIRYCTSRSCFSCRNRFNIFRFENQDSQIRIQNDLVPSIRYCTSRSCFSYRNKVKVRRRLAAIRVSAMTWCIWTGIAARNTAICPSPLIQIAASVAVPAYRMPWCIHQVPHRGRHLGDVGIRRHGPLHAELK
jgi:hypothetical protein